MLDRLKHLKPSNGPSTGSVGVWLLLDPRPVEQGWTGWIIFQYFVAPPIGPGFVGPVGVWLLLDPRPVEQC